MTPQVTDFLKLTLSAMVVVLVKDRFNSGRRWPISPMSWLLMSTLMLVLMVWGFVRGGWDGATYTLGYYGIVWLILWVIPGRQR